MIFIVHGADSTKSYNLILEQQKKYKVKNKTDTAIPDISPTELFEKCSSSSLFGDAPFIVCDITNTGKTDLADYISQIQKIPQNAALILYATKSLPKTNGFIKNADKLSAKVFKLDKIPQGNIFRFLDALFSKSRNKSYKELTNLLEEGQDEFYIFSMILYQLRILAKTKIQAPSITKMKPFQIAKAQKSLDGMTNSIEDLYLQIAELDKKVKTGQISHEIFITVAIEKVLNS